MNIWDFSLLKQSVGTLKTYNLFNVLQTQNQILTKVTALLRGLQSACWLEWRKNDSSMSNLFVNRTFFISKPHLVNVINLLGSKTVFNNSNNHQKSVVFPWMTTNFLRVIKTCFNPRKLTSLLFEREIVAYLFNSILFHKSLIF